MADLEISNLPPVIIPLPTDEFAMVNDLVTKKITRAQMHSLQPGEIFLLPNGADASTPELQFPNSGIYENISDELAFSQGGISVGNLTTPALGGMLINNTLTGSGFERVLTISDIGSFGEYRTTFDATVGTFPVTSFQGDWFNCTVAGTVGGQAFIVGDILIALIDNPSTTIFASNWSIVPHIGVTTLLGLSDVDLTGQANNDLLFRSGGLWVDTAGALTWDGSNLSATNFGGIAEANLLDKTAAETVSGLYTYSGRIDFTSVAGFLNQIRLARGGVSFWDIAQSGDELVFTAETSAAFGTETRIYFDPSIKLFAVREVSASGTWNLGSSTQKWKDIHLSGAVNAATYGGIAEANLLDKTATELVSGSWTLSNTTRFQGRIEVNLDNEVFRFNAISVEVGHTTPHTMTQTWAGADDRLFFFPTIDGTPDFGKEFGFDFALEEWQFDALNAGVLTATSYGGITEANLLDKSAAEIVAGPWEFTAAMTISQASGEKLILKDSNSTGDAVLNFIAFNDMNDFRQGFIGYGSSSNDNFSINNTLGDILLVAANTDVSGALTATSYDGVLAANLLDKSASETISGEYIFTAPTRMIIQAAAPKLQIWETGVTTDNAKWELVADSELFKIRAITDDLIGAVNAITINRTGITIDDVNVLAPLTATSYGGITEANLLDKTAAESITGLWSFLANVDLQDNQLRRSEFRDYAITKHTEAESGGVLDLNMALGNSISFTFVNNVTSVTVSNPPASGRHGEIWLRLKQHATVPKTITWPSKFKFPGKIKHQMSGGVNEVDLVHLVTIDGGVTYDVTFVQDMG